MKLKIGELVFIRCKPGLFPFFMKVINGKLAPLMTPPEFDEPGKYPVIFLGFSTGIIPHSPEEKCFRFLSASGIWYLSSTHNTTLEKFVEKIQHV